MGRKTDAEITINALQNTIDHMRAHAARAADYGDWGPTAKVAALQAEIEKIRARQAQGA